MGTVQQLYIGGRWTDGAGSFLIRSRYGGVVLAEVASASAEQATAAAAQA